MIGIDSSYLQRKAEEEKEPTPRTASTILPAPPTPTSVPPSSDVYTLFWERIKNIGVAGAKQTGGSYAGAFATVDKLMDSSGFKEQIAVDTSRRSEIEAERDMYIQESRNRGFEPDETVLADYDRQLSAMDEGITDLETATVKAKERTAKAYETSQRLMTEGAQAQEEAKEGTGKLGSFLVDAGVAGVQMAGDAAAGLITGSPKSAMLIRSFGAGASNSAMNGGSVDEQLYEGAKSAALEYFTEKLFGGNPIYDDGGIVTDFLYKAADKFGSSQAVTKVLSSLPVKMAEEGLEEVLASVLDPVVNRAANWIDGGARETDMPGLEELLREGAIGALLGGVANVATGNVGNRNVPSAPGAETQAETAPETPTALEAAEAADTQQTETDTTESENAVKLNSAPVTEQAELTFEPFDPIKSLANIQPAPQTAVQPVTEAAEPSDWVSPILSAIERGEPIRTAPAYLIDSQPAEAAASMPIEDTTDYDSMIAALPDSRLIPPGENPARDFRSPVDAADGNLQSRSFRTVGEAETTSPQMAAVMKTGFAEGIGSYVGDSNRAQVDRAVESVKRFGYRQSMTTFLQTVDRGNADADTVALGAVLLKAASDTGSSQDFLDLYKAYSRLATRAGQAVQAQRIFKRLGSMMEGFVATMTPADRLAVMQDSVLSYNEDLRKRFPNGVRLHSLSRSAAQDAKSTSEITGSFMNRRAQDYEISLDPELAKEFLSAETEEQRAEISNRIIRDLARQAPSTWQEKLNGWRYFAMLFNPRTHIKNIVSNAATSPVRAAKDTLRIGLEKAFIRDSQDRTVTSLNRFSPEDKALLAHAKIVYGEVEEDLMSTGKWETVGANAIDRAKATFNRNRPLEWLSSKSSDLLMEEDRWFSKPAFTTAFAADCKVHGITAADLQNGTVDKSLLEQITQRSIQTSRKATFREMSQLADLMNKITTVRPGDKAVTRAAKNVAGVIFPFRSTPANITTQAFEYSPLGLGKSIWDMCTKVRSGDMSAAQAINEFAAGFTGTVLMAIGVFLGRNGLLTGGEDDDKKQQEYNELQGWQGYSVHVGDTYYSIENMGIGAIPLLVGVELDRILRSDYETTFSGTMEAMSNITDPIFEMTMLSSVTDLLENLSYANGHYLKAIAAPIAQNFVSQLVPTLGGAIERTTENTVYSTFTDRTKDGGTLEIGNLEIDTPVLQGMNNVQYGLGTILNKIPGVEYNQIPRLDAWGRVEKTGEPLYRAFTNFISPGYISPDASTDVDAELQRLYDTGIDGSSGVFPDKASQSVKVNGHYLTADEYVKYQSTMGGTSLDLLQNIMNGTTWRDLTDQERIDITDSVYDYARARAQLSVDSSTEVDSWITDELELRAAYNMSLPEYVTAYARYGKVFLDSDATKAVVAAGGSMNDFYKARETMSDLPKAPGRSNVLAWQKLIYMSTQDFPEAAKEAYYKEIMNSDNTYAEWQAAKENGHTMKEWAADHYESYVPGVMYYTVISSGSADSSPSPSIEGILAQYGLQGG